MVDVAFSFRSSGIASAPGSRPDATVLRSGPSTPVQTDLASGRAVVETGGDEASRFQPSERFADQARRAAAVTTFVENHSHYDTEARTVVYQSIDAATEQVVHQFPGRRRAEAARLLQPAREERDEILERRAARGGRQRLICARPE